MGWPRSDCGGCKPRPRPEKSADGSHPGPPLAAVRRTPRGLRRWATLGLVVAVLVAGFGLVLSLGLGGPDVSKTISNLGLCAGALTAAIACLVRAATLRGRMRATWGLIGLGVLSWGLGQVTGVALETFTGSIPLPSQADIGYLGMVLLTPAGLLMLPVAAQTLANRARSVLDGLMVAASLMLMAWIFVVEPLIEAGGDSALALYVSLAYPLGDVVIVTIVIYMLALQRRRGRSLAHLAFVGAGIVAFAVSDICYAYLNLIGAYRSGGVTDIGWFAGFCLILLAATRPVQDASEQDQAEETGSQPIGVLLPYVAVLAALATSVVWYAQTGQSSAFVAYSRSALILLIVGRQLLTLLENRGLTRDLEARVASRTAELFASEQRFHALVQHSSDVVTVVGVDSEVLYQSESVQRVFGYPAQVLTGRRLTSVITAEAAGRLADALRSVSVRPYATTVLEVTVRHRDRRLRQAEITITNLLADPNVGGLVLNTRDISERKELQEQLVHEAYHDALTQLANRALFREKVAEALAQRTGDDEVSVLFLDLDGFKEVNDSLGHLAGDMLLVQVADRLTQSVRDGDVVARFGGDEFAVLICSPRETDDAENVARRIVHGLHEPFRIEERDLHVRGSVGLAAHSSLGEGAGARGDDAEQLMRNADLAMYKAKATGGSDYAAYDPQMLSGLVERLELEADLRLALDRGELELHYQPTIDMTDSRVIGFEALVRWRHLTRGLISPMSFIPLAEATGMIVPLGRWVLEEACRQAMDWAAQTGQPPVKMAVNVSVRQFDRTDLAAEVLDVLQRTGMPADRLCLEMTESVLMTDTEENLAQLLKLKALGVTLAIDDFGTGYSSLAYLRRFPVDTLKIDRSFVERLGEQTDATALASTIVQLGQSLGMSTVAEGIEEYGQLAALRTMGCTFAQGFYFSRPVPAATAGQLLLDSSPEMLEKR
ncbi:bifunctional diguanylate cyclase/phosphodiesterase [Actinoplanes sp. TFC3]|uniref:putative bifunctional diguanylate cyclase/phosphodiesterase n=1 Tax=Actinoplanes sp. TFC3 TaxID=1710355 RepID=UPI0009E9382A|nr:GGDEF domain-containing phosphodiesterase [Actinoplanes sp. TFC3]